MDNKYKNWIQELKQRICASQIKASIAVNEEMILLNWHIGKEILDKQSTQNWGSKVVEQMAKDLKSELPDTKGFSRTNLFAMRQFYSFYKDCAIVHQAAGQLENNALNHENKLVQHAVGLLSKNSILCRIPWRHHIAILGKCQTIETAIFYI